MAGIPIPQQLKPITSYIRRAEELDRDTTNPDSRTVAYFCRAYAMDQALILRGSAPTPDVSNFLLSLISRLEADKKSVPNSSKEAGHPIVEAFAFNVFEKADDEDRAGLSDKGTARTFYAAGTFLDILAQFGELSEEVKEKKKYAKWKAADILNAIKEGRQPAAGGFGESSQPAAAEPVDDFGIPAAPTTFPTMPAMPPQATPVDGNYAQFIPAAPGVSPEPTPAYSAPRPSVTPSPAPSTQLPPMQPYTSAPLPVAQARPIQPTIPPLAQVAPGPAAPKSSAPYNPRAVNRAKDPTTTDAIELCNFAIAALKHNEVDLAVQRLEEALRRLGRR